MHHLNLKKRHVLLTTIVFLLLVADLWAWRRMGPSVQIVLLAFSGMFIFFGLLVAYRRLHTQMAAGQRDLTLAMSDHYRQMEALISLYAVIKPDLPLPTSRGWAASPDFLKQVAEVILHGQPELVVEASSGFSTLVTAYCLKRIGKGKVVSLEHDAQYAEATRSVIALHGMQDVATVIHAPLTEVDIDHHKWLWYDLDRLQIDQPIDVLIIDGPPKATQSLARYPALPLLRRHLKHDATILLDDGVRDDEQETVARWEKEFPEITSEYLRLEKGAFLIKRHSEKRVDTKQQNATPETSVR